MCQRCNDKKWIEEITYFGKSIENLETGHVFYGYDNYFRITNSIAKNISGLEGVKLYQEMSNPKSKLNHLTKFDSKMIPCDCS